MEKTNISRRWLRTGLGSGFLFVAVVGSSLWLPHSQSNSQEDLPQIRNETASFQLVSQEKNERFLVLAMRNVSAKGITAYSVSLDRNSRENTDYTIGGHVIEPGDVEEIEFSLSAIKTKSSNGKKIEICILAVVFEDHTSEGNPGAAAMIKEDRLGQKTQLKRINRLIHNTLKSLDADLSMAFGSLKSEIALLPEDPYKDRSSDFQLGLRAAKARILRFIEEELEQKETAKSMPTKSGSAAFLREGLNKILQESEKWADRY